MLTFSNNATAPRVDNKLSTLRDCVESLGAH
jgi:hypothetical protein